MTTSLFPPLLGRTVEANGMWGTQSNFRAFDKIVEQKFPNPILADNVQYEDVELKDPESGKRLLSVLQYLEGIRFYVGG